MENSKDPNKDKPYPPKNPYKRWRANEENLRQERETTASEEDRTIEATPSTSALTTADFPPPSTSALTTSDLPPPSTSALTTSNLPPTSTSALTSSDLPLPSTSALTTSVLSLPSTSALTTSVLSLPSTSAVTTSDLPLPSTSALTTSDLSHASLPGTSSSENKLVLTSCSETVSSTANESPSGSAEELPQASGTTYCDICSLEISSKKRDGMLSHKIQTHIEILLKPDIRISLSNQDLREYCVESINELMLPSNKDRGKPKEMVCSICHMYLSERRYMQGHLFKRHKEVLVAKVIQLHKKYTTVAELRNKTIPS